MSGRRLDVEDVAFLHAVVKKTGTGARRHVGFVRRRFFSLDRDAIKFFLMGTFGKRVAADQRLVASRQIQLKRQILSRLERGERTAVVRFQIKCGDVVALGNFFGDGEFAQAVPAGLRLLGFAATKFGLLQLRAEIFERDTILIALGVQSQQRAKNFQREPEEQSGQQRDPNGEA